MRRWLLRVAALVLVAFVVLQFLPFDAIESRPVTQDAPWPDAEARQLAVSACYDCHSNEVRLEWFDRIAPVSWMVADHVEEGRHELNFSEWDRSQDSDDLAESVPEGEMPLDSYTWAHPGARLDAEEKATLVAALRQLERDGGGRDDDEG